jgi:tetratricopeptide (TPR) repeat protein
MKFLFLSSLVSALSLTALLADVPSAPKKDTPAPATEPKTPEPAKPQLSPNQQAFLNLPEEQRKDFAKHLSEASRMFQAKRIFETLDEIYKAEKIFPDAPELYNLRGSCYVEFRAFDKAMTDFQKALSLSPGNPSVEFNMAEVLFVTARQTGKWQEAHDALEALFKKLPPENMVLGRLVEFKLLLCKEKLGRADEVAALAEKYDYLDDSPYHYFAKAAVAYGQGDLLKAEEWLAMSGRIFREPEILAPWQDTLVEFGYIKSFYGDDAAEATPPTVPGGK